MVPAFIVKLPPSAINTPPPPFFVSGVTGEGLILSPTTLLLRINESLPFIIRLDEAAT